MDSKPSLKQRLRNKELTLGSWITLGHPSVAEIMCQAGYDWLTVDMEHSVITLDKAQALLQIISLSGLAPLVRVGVNDSNLIKRVMDAGAHGVIVPMVNSREEALKAVQSVKYPPVGFRGVGLARAQGYGASFPHYKEWNDKHSVVIVQVEHIKAVENLRSILSIEEVDGFIIGPYDLSGSLGYPGEFDHPKVIEALEEVKRVTQEMDAVSGFHVIPPDNSALNEKIEEGYLFVAHSLDILFLGEGSKRSLNAIKK